MSDVTKRGEIFGMESTTYFGACYNTLAASSDTRNVMPGGNARLGLLASNTFSSTSNYGVRAREELKIAPNLTAIAGIGWETTVLRGVNTAYAYPTPNVPTAITTLISPTGNSRTPRPSWRCSTSSIPNGSSARVSPPATARRRSATSSSSRTAERQQHAAQDAEEPRLRHRLRLDAEQYAHIQRDRLSTNSSGTSW